MTNILFVSCYSTDINNSASIELIYYINLLAKSGKFNVHLLTMDFPNNTIYYDSEISKFVHKNVVVHRVKGGIILDRMLPRVSFNSDKKEFKNYKSILIKVKNIVTMVDPYISWTYKAFKYFKENLKDIKFDIILGMHEPPSSLICSYKIKDFIKKNNLNIKLISYFSDPYCNELSRKKRSFFIRKLNEVIEKKIVRKSDKFLFVTQNNFEYYKDKYGINSNNMELIHRCFDKEIYKNCDKSYPIEFSKSKINLLHAGDIVSGMRDVTNFIKALDCINQNYNEKFKKLNINFYGNINDFNQEKLVKSKDYICFKHRVSYSKIINFMINSDVLIIFANKEFKQIPAKIYDYMGTNSYILIIFESYEDPLYKLVKNIEGVICVLNNCDDIVIILMNLIDSFNVNSYFDRSNFNNNEDIYKKLENVFYK